MKRKAVIIGNTSGLPGVSVDVNRFTKFLNDDVGGAWYSTEIDIFQNEKKSILIQKINTLKSQSFDYVIVLFSGHGGHSRQTILEINGQGETIEETSLRGIAPRQLNIYDCCRTISTLAKSELTASLTTSFAESVKNIRQVYENRIMQAIPQQALLYSCSVGQTSSDTSKGGMYLNNLLTVSQRFYPNPDFKLVGTAHEEAAVLTKQESSNRQTPEAILPKCLSTQQLIISIHP